jgi:hypothetical protein
MNLLHIWDGVGIYWNTLWGRGVNWEESKALTPLKHDFLKAFFEINRDFFLTGGAALGVFYLQHRLSFDLDFFTTKENMNWRILDGEIRSVSNSISASCLSITVTPTFRRYKLVRKDEREILDFVIDFVPQIDSDKEQVDNIVIDTLREITINKICTLVERCEIKDVLDLYFLDRSGVKVVDYFNDAKKKEGGLDPAMLSYILDRMKIDSVPDYVLEPVEVGEIQEFVESLRKLFADMAYPKL